MPFAVAQPGGRVAHVLDEDERLLAMLADADGLGFSFGKIFKPVTKFLSNNKNTIGTIASVAGPVLAPVTGGASLAIAAGVQGAVALSAGEQAKELQKDAEEEYKRQVQEGLKAAGTLIGGSKGAAVANVVGTLVAPGIIKPLGSASTSPAFDALPERERTWINLATRLERMVESDREAAVRGYTIGARRELARVADQYASMMGTTWPFLRATLARVGNAAQVTSSSTAGGSGGAMVGVAAVALLAVVALAGSRR